jgi:hypothetical protein
MRIYGQYIGEDESSYMPAKYLAQIGLEVWKPFADGGLLLVLRIRVDTLLGNRPAVLTTTAPTPGPLRHRGLSLHGPRHRLHSTRIREYGDRAHLPPPTATCGPPPRGLAPEPMIGDLRNTVARSTVRVHGALEGAAGDGLVRSISESIDSSPSTAEARRSDASASSAGGTNSSREEPRCWPVFSCCVCRCASPCGSLAGAGDEALRSDIQLLADAGILRGPVTTWPMSWPDIARDARAADDVGLDEALRRAARAQRWRAPRRLASPDWVPRRGARTAQHAARLRRQPA